MKSNPKTFVLVHGSWQGAWSWHGVRGRLRARGHRVITPALPGRGGIGEDRSWIGHDDNVAAVLAALDADGAGGDHEMPLTAPRSLADALHHLAMAPAGNTTSS